MGNVHHVQQLVQTLESMNWYVDTHECRGELIEAVDAFACGLAEARSQMAAASQAVETMEGAEWALIGLERSILVAKQALWETDTLVMMWDCSSREA